MNSDRDKRMMDGRAAGVPSPADMLWLSFLALYLTPWITSAPPASNWKASAVGTIGFLLVYIHSYRCAPRHLILHVIATALIGFALARFGGVWNVFNVCAASIAARLEPRRYAIAVIIALQVSLAIVGLSLQQPAVAWVSGVYFSILAAGTTMLLGDLARRNKQLEAAQGEIRRLGAAAERERIARDLHDLLGRTLTAIALKANLARRLVDRDPARAEREIDEVAGEARQALNEVRVAVTGIAGRSLVAEIDHARTVLNAAEIEIVVEAGEIPTAVRQEEAMAMVLREAVTNVVRHSEARHCRIRYDKHPDGFFIEVSDDGRGGVIEGFGIAGMRRRLAALGGRLSFGDGDPGTIAHATLPGHWR